MTCPTCHAQWSPVFPDQPSTRPCPACGAPVKVRTRKPRRPTPTQLRARDAAAAAAAGNADHFRPRPPRVTTPLPDAPELYGACTACGWFFRRPQRRPTCAVKAACDRRAAAR